MNFIGRYRAMWTLAVLAACSASVVAQDTADSGIAVSIRVSEDNGLARDGAPVRLGVPLPPDAPTDPTKFAVVDPYGTPVDSDRWVMARWNGAPQDERLPIRWLGVSFRATVGPARETTYTLVSTTAEASTAVSIATETAAGIVLDNGSMSARVPATGTTLVEDIWIDLDGHPGLDAPMVRTGHEGGLLGGSGLGAAQRWAATSAVLVRNGTTSALVQVDLVHPNSAARGVLWVELHRGVPSLRLRLELDNSSAEGSQSASLVLPVSTLGDPLTLGVRRGVDAPVMEGPLPYDGTLRLEPSDQGWAGTLGDARADGLTPWAQMSSITWRAAMAATPGSDVAGIRVGGNGAFWIDLNGQEGAIRADMMFEARSRNATNSALADFSNPVSAGLTNPAAIATALGPLALSPAWGSADEADPALAALAEFVRSGDRAALDAARATAVTALRTRRAVRGAAAVARITADVALAREVAAITGTADASLSAARQALNALVAWELAGDRTALMHTRAILRAGIGAAWAADVCVVADRDPADLALLIQATAQYIAVRWAQGAVDEAAENAMAGMLERLASCPPRHTNWRYTWSLAAQVAPDPQAQQRWAALGETGITGARFGQ